MSNVVEYNTIVSKARTHDNKLLVITASEKEDKLYVSPQQYGNDHQLWEKRQVRSGDTNAYALVNKATGTCIGRKDATNGSKLYLESVSEADVNGLMVWRDDHVTGTHNAINSYVDWEQKVNIPGNGPYADGNVLVTWEWSKGQPNELWVFVPDKKTISVKRMDFQMDKAIILNSVPIVSSKQIVSNHTDTEQTQKVTLSFSKGYTYSFTRERGIKISETVKFKGGLPLVGESEVEIVVEGSRTYSETNTQEDTQEITTEVPVVLPPRKSIEVSAILLQGIIDVPYTVTFDIEYPGKKVEETVSGKYTGVNTFTMKTDFKLLGD
ncbi:ETX/MTX2 family pore-forming toxin [Paenibacillus sp. ACRRX]|uniref:ETX/MTX2 family pore-forming toxin n=1 Tax=unclassified Paenibacillus TaxID=185978 RepID=UPI001EF64BBD|nr:MULTISPECIES: ETX/MTX2 family pore-forming toxin [unclassified Paenibacillus]MCG7406645.1 ETX/MTX2 family pore-forming toxin [Paenibacillus sp. ACRRX]MDK8179662.1 ETX/MTX2 family pore-forming toxin [Paenibacillus sp. UMB4589-SE434]